MRESSLFVLCYQPRLLKAFRRSTKMFLPLMLLTSSLTHAQIAPGVGRFGMSSSDPVNERNEKKAAKIEEKTAVLTAKKASESGDQNKSLKDAEKKAKNDYTSTIRSIDDKYAFAKLDKQIDMLTAGTTTDNKVTYVSGTDNSVVISKSTVVEESVINATATDIITLHDTGSTDYTISSTTKTGPGATDFTVTGCTPNIISKNSPDCVLTVVYAPKAASIASYAQLAITLVSANVLVAPPSQPGTVTPAPTATGTPSAPATGTPAPTATGTPAPTATGTPSAPATGTPSTPAANSVPYTVNLSGYPAAACTGTAGYAVYLSEKYIPLTHRGIDDATINCYYNTSKNFAFATQVGYQYNPSGGASTVSSDLFSFQFTGGIQMSLVGNANTGSCSTTATSSNSTGSASSTSSSCGTSATSTGSTTATTTPSLQQDVQTLEQGGDFALKALYPLLNLRGNRFQVLSFATPRVGFTVNGLSATTNTTNATDINLNVANENYLQVDALPTQTGGDSPASIFADYRWGYEHISDTFAANSGLMNQNFLLQQLEVGICLTGSFKISADRYFGPNQVYVTSAGMQASASNFSNWSLRVQITPSSLGSSK